MNKLVLLMIMAGFQNAQAFDLSDYLTTLNYTQDAHAKADRELGLAESSLIVFLDENSNIIPIHIDSLHAMGSAIQAKECSFQEACATARKPATVKANIASIVADSKVRALPADPTSLDDLKTNVDSYVDALSASKLTEEAKLFKAQATKPVWNEIVDSIVGEGGTDPFSSTVDTSTLMTQYREKRDAYLKSVNEWKLSVGPWRAAQAGYATAVQTYYNMSGCSGFMGLKSMDDWAAAGAPLAQ